MQCSPAVELKAEDRQVRTGLRRSRVALVRVVQHAPVRLRLADGVSPPQAARQVGVGASTARRIGSRYRTQGLDDAL